MQQLGVNDKKISALTAVTAAVGTHELPVNESGTTKKLTVDQIATYISRSIYNASVSNQGAGFASDTYLTGSSISIPNNSLQAKTMYICTFNVSKTAAGTATPIINIRIGTAGTTADTSRGTLTFAAQTAAADAGQFDIFCTFRTVGSGTSAVLQSVGRLTHGLSITGLGTDVSGSKTATSAGFDSTVSNSIIGLSINGGTSAAWTVNLVQTQLINLA